jgi:hypothetical protein
MKVNFNEGVQRVIDLLVEFDNDFEADMLQDIKIIANREEENTIDEIEKIIESIKIQKRCVKEAIERLEKADSLKDILLAMRNTVYEEEEAAILKAFLSIDNITIS